MDMTKILDLTDLELLICVISAAIHDLDHPGRNNNYHRVSGHRLSMIYNDISILENYHLFFFFSLIKHDDLNIFSHMDKKEFSEVRTKIISNVFATDMSLRDKKLKKFNTVTEAKDFSPKEKEAKGLIMNEVIHFCDIANASKPFQMAKQWTDIIIEEFFCQGDLEKEMGFPVSFGCDRTTIKIPENQMFFIDKFVLNEINILLPIFPKMEVFKTQILKNREEWEKFTIIDYENKKIR